MHKILKMAAFALSLAAWTAAASAQDAKKMESMPGMKMDAKPAAGQQAVMGTGTVQKVDPAKRMVTLNHEPIKAIEWPAMTMDFAVSKDVDIASLKNGQQVEFSLVKSGNNYTIASIKPKS